MATPLIYGAVLCFLFGFALPPIMALVLKLLGDKRSFWEIWWSI